MTEREMVKHIGTIPPLAWDAVLQVVADAASLEVEVSSAPDLSDGARHFNAGRLSMVGDLKDALESMRASLAEEGDLES